MSRPVAVFSVAAPEDRNILTQWEKHLLPLQQAGSISIWSENYLRVGEDRNAQIQLYFERADLVLLLLSASFFASRECRALMEKALRRSRQQQVRVVPVLLRSVAWQDTALGGLMSLPTDGQPVTLWKNRDEAFLNCIEALKPLLPPGGRALIPDEDQSEKAAARPSRPAEPGRYHSCFIAYAHQDEPFASRLYRDLSACGVRCWSAPRNMKIGERIRPTIDLAIQKQEKLLLVLSTYALRSTWIEDEVEAAFEYERLEEREMLFPIRLDDSVMNTTQAWARKLRRTRHIGDFTELSGYQDAFEQLLNDLTIVEEDL